MGTVILPDGNTRITYAFKSRTIFSHESGFCRNIYKDTDDFCFEYGEFADFVCYNEQSKKFSIGSKFVGLYEKFWEYFSKIKTNKLTLIGILGNMDYSLQNVVFEAIKKNPAITVLEYDTCHSTTENVSFLDAIDETIDSEIRGDTNIKHVELSGITKSPFAKDLLGAGLPKPTTARGSAPGPLRTVEVFLAGLVTAEKEKQNAEIPKKEKQSIGELTWRDREFPKKTEVVAKEKQRIIEPARNEQKPPEKTQKERDRDTQELMWKYGRC